VNQPITMPALSDTMNNGRLVRWVKKIGDPIKKGEAVAEVETDKAVMDVEAFHDGYLAGPLAQEGAEMSVGSIIGFIADSTTAAAPAGEKTAPSAPPISTASASLTPAAAPASARPPPPASVRAPEHELARERASPYARRLAREQGIDVKQVISQAREIHAAVGPATGQRASIPELEAGPPYRLERASSVREAVARNMIASVATPSFRVSARLALAPLITVSKEARISLTLLIARACALTISAQTLFNAAYTPEGLAVRERIDVAIAVDTPEGLIAPVLRDVAVRPLSELAADWRGIQEKVVSRRLSAQDYQGATFYLSNLGTFPVVDSFDAVLPLGAAAILCVAASHGERASFTLGCDHRVLAGADAARFLQALAEWLASPQKLIGTVPQAT
jgi:pyruvate dehydrogenase E2 component (dihydrolipoamide acetyltransferase)